MIALIDDFHNWKIWSSQDRDDPSFVREFSGASSGVGAISNWQGKGSSGKGRSEITESTPGQLVVVKVDFAAVRCAQRQPVCAVGGGRKHARCVVDARNESLHC